MLKQLRYRSQYYLLLLFHGVVRLLPRATALALGRRIGGWLPLLQPRRRRKAEENLRHAFPELSEPERARLVWENFRQLGISGVEMLRLDLYRDPELVRRYFDMQGMEYLREAFDLGRGTFILTGHVGFWEAGAMFLPQLGFPTDFVYKRMKNPFVEARLLAMRESGGGQCIEKGRAARKILRSLAENRAVAILFDQRLAPREAVQVNFFGRPANATPIIAQIAIKQGTPIVPIFSHRLPDNRYAIVAEPMILLPQSDNPTPEEVVAATQLLTDRIEAAVRRTPEQWFWVHDRWRL